MVAAVRRGPFVSTVAAERLFRHKVIAMLRDEGLLTEERIALLRSWRHSGFSAHNAVTVPPGDTGGIERLARYFVALASRALDIRAPATFRFEGW